MTLGGERAYAQLRDDITGCTLCPRLVEHRRAIAARPPARHRGVAYWSRPVPGFGRPWARAWLVGLAPSAHGANRTGRMFTGDPSAAFLTASLHRAGFANLPTSETAADGLVLRDLFVTAAARCAPPQNRLLPAELAACRRHLDGEWALGVAMRGGRPPAVVIALGRVAYDSVRALLRRQCGFELPRAFAHGLAVQPSAELTVLGAYHPSPQNTNTGRLTPPMLDAVLLRARQELD